MVSSSDEKYLSVENKTDSTAKSYKLTWKGFFSLDGFCVVFFLPTGLALASGLAATVTITHMLKAGDGIVCMDDVYGGETPRWGFRHLRQTPCSLHHSLVQNDGWRESETGSNRQLGYLWKCWLEFHSLYCKALIATSRKLLLHSVWRCRLLTAQNQSCWRPRWRPTPK